MDIKFKAIINGDSDGQATARLCNDLVVPHVIINGECILASPSREMINALGKNGAQVIDVLTGRICCLKKL